MGSGAEVLLQGVLEAHAGRYGRRCCPHRVRGRALRQLFLCPNPCLGASSGGHERERDDEQEQAVATARGQLLVGQQPDADPNGGAHVAAHPLRAAAAAGDPPHDRRQHPAAVQRQSRQRVEDREQQVEPGQLDHHVVNGAVQGPRDQPERAAHHQRAGRSRRRNQEFGPRTPRVRPGLRCPAEEHHRDPTHGDVQALRHPRMRQFVHEDSPEERSHEQHRQPEGMPRIDLTEAGVLAGGDE